MVGLRWWERERERERERESINLVCGRAQVVGEGEGAVEVI